MKRKKHKKEWQPLILILSIVSIIVLLYLSINFMLPNTEQNLTLQTKTSISASMNENFFVDDDVVMGKKNAPILIVEFGEFMCPFCGEVHKNIEPLWRKEYIETGKARYVFRDFVPIKHPQAFPAAEANQCAALQGKQWQMYDILFDNAYTGDTWAKIEDKENLTNTFKKYGKQIGLDLEQFSSCLSNHYFANEIYQDIFAGMSLGISGTPTIFIGNDKTGFTKVLGAQPYSVYKQIIDEKLNSS